tara:strand:- start:84 stop:581 length:498 start_codon:yes stop_codon:yes gene_type:complete
MICDIETLQMAIGEISSRLSDLVAKESYFEFSPFADDVFTSDAIDLTIRETMPSFMIEVAEPVCGIPNLELVLLRDNVSIRNQIEMIWDATRKRKSFLSDVMTEVVNLNSGKMIPDASVRMIDVADACDLHITMVSRILDNKTCRVDDRMFPCRQYIHGLRSNEN